MVKRTAERKIGSEAGRFDAFRLAARGEALRGEIDVAGRERIADRLAATGGPVRVAWKIEGGRDALERPVLRVRLQGSVPLVCQRCLQPIEVALDQRSELLLAREETELARLDADEREVVLAAAPLDAKTLVEDELLLSLPFAPMHPEMQCPWGAGSVGARDVQSETSPFARLAAIKKGRGETHEE